MAVIGVDGVGKVAGVHLRALESVLGIFLRRDRRAIIRGIHQRFTVNSEKQERVWVEVSRRSCLKGDW